MSPSSIYEKANICSVGGVVARQVISVRLGQFTKGVMPILVTLAGMVTLRSDVHPKSRVVVTSVMFGGRTMDSSFSQKPNAAVPIFVMDSGKLTFCSEVQ